MLPPHAQRLLALILGSQAKHEILYTQRNRRPACYASRVDALGVDEELPAVAPHARVQVHVFTLALIGFSAVGIDPVPIIAPSQVLGLVDGHAPKGGLDFYGKTPGGCSARRAPSILPSPRRCQRCSRMPSSRVASNHPTSAAPKDRNRCPAGWLQSWPSLLVCRSRHAQHRH